MLRDAGRALQAGDPRRALDLTDAHAAAYPQGTFAQEREAIAIEALARLGRSEAARDRYQQFITRYPSSNYRARLERLLAAAAPR